MNETYNFKQWPDQMRGGVTIIGNFDGVHKGHQALLSNAKEIAESLGKPLVAITFEPHPRQYFAPEAPPFRLTNRNIKQEALSRYGADHTLFIPFGQRLAEMDPESFITEIMLEHGDVQHIIVGSDFRFGHNRAGDIETLKQLSDKHKFGLTSAKQVKSDDGLIYSSTAIRSSLQRGDVKGAIELLGHAWDIEGTVVHGDKRGRELGYPTANIVVEGLLHPAYGIYAVRVQTPDGKWHDGAANFGIRPMFEIKKPILEVYLFDFDDDLYDKTLRVEFVDYIRPEAKFETLDELKKQMEKDCHNAKLMIQEYETEKGCEDVK